MPTRGLRLAAAIANGQRAYWICPLVEETDKLDAAAAEDRHRALTAVLPDANPVLAHGRMKTEQREEAMSAFKDGTSKLLVATTVIEVGVDVPEASIIMDDINSGHVADKGGGITHRHNRSPKVGDTA